jgi:carbamoyl-phosphate synthase small subunit
MNGILSTVDFDDASLAAKLAAAPSMEGLDLVRGVTTREAYDFKPEEAYPRKSGRRLKVVALDFGIKRNILELMHAENFDVRVVPAHTSADAILALKS